MGFAPDWVLGATCGVITHKYVIGDLPLQAYTNKFSKGLSESYDDASGDKLMAITEEMMQFLASVDGDGAMLINSAYIFNIVNFDENGGKRKIKGLFKSALAAQKKEVTIDDVLKSFRTFAFSMRSNPNLLAPKGWNISQTADIEWLTEIFDQRVRITDSF
jgi:hypothetical protein